MNNYFGQSFTALSAVFFDGAFSARALNSVLTDDLKKEDKGLITNIFYGVIQNNDYLENTLSGYITSKPKPKIKLLLKIGLYVIVYLDKIPLYAVCDNAVNYSKKINAGNYTPLVNAVMRKMCELRGVEKSTEITLPDWFKIKLLEYYGAEIIEKILTSEIKRTHVRLNENLISSIVFEAKMKKSGVGFSRSEQDGYYVDDVAAIKELYDKGMVTTQSPSSVLTAKTFGKNISGNLLDSCAAPGGKSVFLAEKNKNLFVTSCDVYPHRTDLISSYVKRMKAERINILLEDATVYNENFSEYFDYVLCDAPCSGTGTFKRKPDVFLNKTENDVKSLTKLQKSITENVVKYLKTGGRIVYSTCSLLDDENDNIVENMLNKYSLSVIDFTPETDKNNYVCKKYGKQILPMDGYDGFYIALLEKN